MLFSEGRGDEGGEEGYICGSQIAIAKCNSSILIATLIRCSKALFLATPLLSSSHVRLIVACSSSCSCSSSSSSSSSIASSTFNCLFHSSCILLLLVVAVVIVALHLVVHGDLHTVLPNSASPSTSSSPSRLYPDVRLYGLDGILFPKGARGEDVVRELLIAINVMNR